MVFKNILISLMVATLIGCAAEPQSMGHTYTGDHFTRLLNKVDTIDSHVPRDFTRFKAQANEVTKTSPRLTSVYGSLYEQLNKWATESGDPQSLANYGIEIAQLGGADDQGNVLFTGYFSPVIELRHKPDPQFKYPIYAKPDCDKHCPTRAQIYAGALAGQGLEIGYAANQIDPFLMEVQGSGFVHFGDDDTLQYFAYAGKNNHPYVSIGKVLIERDEILREHMSMKAIKAWVKQQDEAKVRELLEQNPSFVFFAPKTEPSVLGSASVPLLPMAAVAGDRTLFPMGTPILAEVPLLNSDGTWSGVHQLRLLIVLDTGGAVKENHLDLYYGIGARAGIEAGHNKHFGRVWKLGLSHSPTSAPWALSPEGKHH